MFTPLVSVCRRRLDLESFNQRTKVFNHLGSRPPAPVIVDAEVFEFESGLIAIPKAGVQGRQLRLLGGHLEGDRFEVLAQDDRFLPLIW